MKPLSDSPGLFQKCKNNLLKKLDDVGLTPATLVLVVRYAMEIVELTKKHIKFIKGCELNNTFRNCQ